MKSRAVMAATARRFSPQFRAGVADSRWMKGLVWFVVSHPCDRKKLQGWGTEYLFLFSPYIPSPYFSLSFSEERPGEDALGFGNHR